MAGWVYLQSEPNLWTVGFYDPKGFWHADDDFSTREAARERVAHLNGRNQSLDEALNSRDGSYKP